MVTSTETRQVQSRNTHASFVLHEALRWLQEFRREKDRNTRQAFNKVFSAWKTVAALVALLGAMESRGLLNELRRRGFVEDGSVRVTTANAVKVLRLVAKQGPGKLREVAQGLLELRKEAYMLHTAFYEGAEHAGFEEEEEAKRVAEELAKKLAKILRELEAFTG